MAKVTAVVLASGFSSRFGTNKLIQELAGKPLLTYILKAVQDCRFHRSIAVVEPGNDSVISIIPENWQVAENTGRGEGISSAVRTGLSAVDAESDAVLFLVADQPFVTSSLIEELISRFEQGGCDIVACVLEGVAVNPMLFGRSLFKELVSVSGDVGAKSILPSHRKRTCLIPVDDPDTLLDVDTQEDMERAEEILHRKFSL